MKFRRGAGIPQFPAGAASTDDSPHQRGELYVTIERLSYHRQRPQDHDGDFLGVLTHQVKEQFVATQSVVKLSARKRLGPEAIGTMKPPAIDVIFHRGRRADPGQARWINLLHQDLYIARGLFPGNVSGRGREADYL